MCQVENTSAALHIVTTTESIGAKTFTSRLSWLLPRLLFVVLIGAVTVAMGFAVFLLSGVFCLQAGCDGYVVAAAVFAFLNEAESVNAVLTAFNLIIAFWLWRLGRRYFAKRADRAVRGSDKQPTIYLRQFRADQADFARYWSIERLNNELLVEGPALFGLPVPRRLRYKRLEEIVGEEVDRTAPFIAIGNPRERLPELGAARAYRTDKDWQQTVADWMQKAATIIVVAAPSEGLQWELTQIVARGLLSKTIVPFTKSPSGHFTCWLRALQFDAA
jgi:hypothetical protein